MRCYGLLQTINPDGARGPDRYIEAHVWAAEPITTYFQKHEENQLQKFTFQPMDETSARTVLSWQYPSPYDFYNPKAENLERDIQFLLDPQYPYFTITNAAGELVAFCTYGLDAQVPGGDYSAEALDIGLGVHPELTGQGQGIVYVRAVVEYGILAYQPDTLRVTVAAFNKRAQRVWEKAGFELKQEFNRQKDSTLFIIMRRKA